MSIQHKTGGTKGEFFIEKNGYAQAKITYSKLGNTQIIVDHTEVSDSFKGEGLGKKLVAHVVQHARNNNLKLIPLCPFAKAIIERDQSLQDVLKKINL